MQTISIIDAILLAVLAIALPVLGARDWQTFLDHRAMPGEVPRLELYRSTIVQAWLVALVVLAAFLLQGRLPVGLGLQWPGGSGALWAMLAIAILGGILLIGLRSALRADAK